MRISVIRMTEARDARHRRGDETGETRSSGDCCSAGSLVHWYQMRNGAMTRKDRFLIERVQTGVRMEKRLLKVLKAFAEYHDMTLGDLLEGIVLHAFDGKPPFEKASLARIKELKRFYGLDLDSRASHRLTEVRAHE